MHYKHIAADCHLDKGQKSVRADPVADNDAAVAAGLAAEHRAFHPRPGMPSDVSETDCEGHTLLGAEYNAPLLGKIVLLGDGTVDHCRKRGLREPRTYVLGRGVEDACASVIYQAETPTFAPAQIWDPIHGYDPAVARITLEDHGHRSPQCLPAKATLILHEEVSTSGHTEIDRTLYGSFTTMLPRPSPPPPRATCPFFVKPAQSAERAARRCEVGAYFVEDDAPGLGKLVELQEWVDETCRHPPPLGRRLYAMYYGKVDACGSITYGEEAVAGFGRPIAASPGLGYGYGLQMIDHRFRKRSAQCADKPALVELVERVYQGGMPSPGVALERHFYSPRVEK